MSGQARPLFTFTFEGRQVRAQPGQSIAAALLEARLAAVRRTRFGDRPRGLYCGIGACFDCLVEVDGAPGPLRACLAPAAPGQLVRGWSGRHAS